MGRERLEQRLGVGLLEMISPNIQRQKAAGEEGFFFFNNTFDG